MSLKDKIELIKKENNISEFPEGYTEKHYRALNLIEPENISKVNNVVKQKDISLTNAMGIIDIKTYLRDAKDIEDTISSIIAVGEKDLLKNYPEVLSDNNVLKYYQRIKLCQDNKIQYKDESGNYADFVLNNAAWNAMVQKNKNMDEPKEVQNNQEQNVDLDRLKELKESIAKTIESLNSEENFEENDNNIRRRVA